MGQPERGDALPILCEEPGAGYRAMSDYGKDPVHAFTQALPVRVGADRMGVPAARMAAARAVC